MPPIYDIALMLTRLCAAINLVAGLAAILGSFIGVVLEIAQVHILDGVGFTLISYGTSYFCVGVGLLLFSKPIAKFAAKASLDRGAP
jgi:hypothetical protein